MAVSRVGGSGGKLKGQVGDIIYQVKKNSDGTYTQYTYTKGGHTEETLTPKLQAQRMCVAMVESLMRDLKPVAGISFQSGTNKSQSINGFSSNNLRLVQRDCKDHWNDNNTFVFPARRRHVARVIDLGGRYMISSGSLNRNNFDALEFDHTPASHYNDIHLFDCMLYGLKFNVRFGVDTVNDFLSAHQMTRSDKVVFCGFRSWINYEPDPDDPQDEYKHDYVIVSLNTRISGNTVMTPEILHSLFVIDSSIGFTFYIARNGRFFTIGYLCDFYNIDEQFFYVAGFTISYLTGRKQISTSFYQNPDGETEPWLLNAAPADVFGSWMDEPWRKPYPSPF